MHPGVAHLQTFLAPIWCARLHVPNLIQMCTSFHATPPSTRPSSYCNPRSFNPVATTALFTMLGTRPSGTGTPACAPFYPATLPTMHPLDIAPVPPTP